MGTVEGAVVALVMERRNAAVWSLNLDTKLLAAAYSGVFCSGLAYYVQGIIMKDRGPVFVTAFNPLSMIIVAVLGSFILGEQMYLGRLLGAVVIVSGLYLVVWGKSKDYKSESLPCHNDPVLCFVFHGFLLVIFKYTGKASSSVATSCPYPKEKTMPQHAYTKIQMLS
ncbi:hypothetical protein POM88_029305 [Heracleum sosnowskyi]|uniref:WAT1-related protein n=1 Tax=Heracleum sosnowskyi TaxID=360622 RepID=A0AAD8MHL9_9APIA|nr:hypothetical protein POM88_029305 [Heracleum sosnowskyi]